MISISLDWQRPLDGVEVIPAADADPRILADGEFIRAKTDRRSPRSIRIDDLSSPVSMLLINARTTERLAGFVGAFGVPQPLGYNHDGSGEYVSMLISLRDDLDRGMQLLNNDDDAARVEWATEHLHQSEFFPSFEWDEGQRRQRLVFKPSTLADLMKCEVALAIEAGAKLHHCERCDAAFLTGHMTGRRASAVYCSDRCRMAALRARNAGKGRF
jgi:hypothetical protein